MPWAAPRGSKFPGRRHSGFADSVSVRVAPLGFALPRFPKVAEVEKFTPTPEPDPEGKWGRFSPATVSPGVVRPLRSRRREPVGSLTKPIGRRKVPCRLLLSRLVFARSMTDQPRVSVGRHPRRSGWLDSFNLLIGIKNVSSFLHT